VFTSTRAGDLELYSMALDGTDVKRLTNAAGYDGGAVYSWDGTRIVWRAARPDAETLKRDKEFLLRDLVKPERLDLWVMDADGKNPVRLTDNGAANFGPFWHPDGRRVIFASNLHDPKGFNFELYLIDVTTKEVERVTHFAREAKPGRWSDDFDGFPMFSADGKRLVFCSNRHNSEPHETNVFVADWVD
jgi:Tol biopolymer transport system component